MKLVKRQESLLPGTRNKESLFFLGETGQKKGKLWGEGGWKKRVVHRWLKNSTISHRGGGEMIEGQTRVGQYLGQKKPEGSVIPATVGWRHSSLGMRGRVQKRKSTSEGGGGGGGKRGERKGSRNGGGRPVLQTGLSNCGGKKGGALTGGGGWEKRVKRLERGFNLWGEKIKSKRSNLNLVVERKWGRVAPKGKRQNFVSGKREGSIKSPAGGKQFWAGALEQLTY